MPGELGHASLLPLLVLWNGPAGVGRRDTVVLGAATCVVPPQPITSRRESNPEEPHNGHVRSPVPSTSATDLHPQRCGMRRMDVIALRLPLRPLVHILRIGNPVVRTPWTRVGDALLSDWFQNQQGQNGSTGNADEEPRGLINTFRCSKSWGDRDNRAGGSQKLLNQSSKERKRENTAQNTT